jgi:hypothetical protein
MRLRPGNPLGQGVGRTVHPDESFARDRLEIDGLIAIVNVIKLSRASVTGFSGTKLSKSTNVVNILSQQLHL